MKIKKYMLLIIIFSFCAGFLFVSCSMDNGSQTQNEINNPIEDVPESLEWSEDIDAGLYRYHSRRPRFDIEEFTVNVMAPLWVEDWQEFEKQLALAGSLGVQGVSVDAWWGRVENSDNVFDWSYYDTIFSKIKNAGLKIVPIMSFHQAGANVGDDVFIPIPDWVWSKYEGVWYCGVILTEDEMKYESELGNINPEVMSLWMDYLVSNEYVDFMNAFENHFGSYANDFQEINISSGPSGELRYPSYSIFDSWSFPHRGYLQSYSEVAKVSFRFSMLVKYFGLRRLNNAWGTNYTSISQIQPPQDTDVFFGNSNYTESRYAEDFIDWYNKQLVYHGKRMIYYAHKAFNGALDGSLLGIKVPGIHWKIDPLQSVALRSAETTVGIIDSDHSKYNGYGYKPIFDLVTRYNDVVLHFTCLEMSDHAESSDSLA